jgi:hypothetical protein
MCLRLAFALMLPGVLATSALAQQTITDVVVQGASMNDAYGGGALTCGVDGQIYRHPSGGGMTSVMRISPDGSTLLFTLPEHVYPGVIAPAGTGLKILSSVYSSAERRSGLQMFHFDNLANLLAQNSVVIPIEPSAMAALPSGRTIVVGSHLKDPDYPDDRKYSFVILDENDELWKSVDLPLPPGGGGWTFIGIRMASRDGVAYVMLHSNQPPQTALATIAEKGNQNLDIKVIAAPFDSEVRHHNEWLFGPGVVVDLFHYTNERPHVTARFDEYDLKTGEKIATKSALPTGFGFGCYLGNEFIMLVPSAHEDPARHLSPETLRLVTTKLRVDEASSPSATDKPH